MKAYPSSDRPAEAERLAGIAGLIRRICVLREQGDVAQANRLQAGELASAVADFRLRSAPGNLPEEKLCAMFVSEAQHVAEARVLAEALAPEVARLMPASDLTRLPLFASVPAAGSPAEIIPRRRSTKSTAVTKGRLRKPLSPEPEAR